MKIINLTFDKLTTSLAGNAYGRQVFKKQVAEVDCDAKYEISFPDQIELIATSFIQGFFDEFVNIMGLEGISNNVTIKAAGISNIKEYVMDCLY